MNYVVTIKPASFDQESYTVTVSTAAVERIKNAMEKKGSCYVGNEYLPYTRIAAITQVGPYQNAIGAGSKNGKYCGNCESGWVYGPEGGRPCKCTPRHAEIVREYKQYLGTQDWYEK